MQKIASIIILLLVFIVIPTVFAEPSVSIVMEQTTFSYGEKLAYIIKVSEVTGDSAIIHIVDNEGKGSSAIPIQISELSTPISAPFPFDKDVFPIGTYHIDVEYSGSEDTTEFNVIDSGKTVFPFWMKQIAYSWINGEISSGLLIDAMQKSMDSDKWTAVKGFDKNNLDAVYVPEWVKTTLAWWLEDKISDDDFAKVIQYLIKSDIITA
jgi:hypothetical protein